MRFIRSAVLALGAAALMTVPTQSAQAQGTIDVGAFSGSGCCNGLTRGFWFVAPVAFQITGLNVFGSPIGGAGSLEVLRLNAPPPAFSAGSTNDFTSLFYSAFTNASVNINIGAGEIIGVLGYDAGAGRTPYSVENSGYGSSIFGNPVTLNRFGFQSTGMAANVWTEPFDLGLIEVDYDVAGSTVPEPATMTLLATGLVAMGAARRRKKNAA